VTGEAAPVPTRLLRDREVLRDTLVRELLALRLVAVLATIGRDGRPHLTPLWFADGGDCVEMATASGSRKLANLERDPRATIVLHESRAGVDVRGVSIEGTVEVVRSSAARAIVERVHRRYVSADGEREAAVAEFLAADDVALCLRPERAWTWDQRGTPAADALRRTGAALPLDA
jgi:PPOX class probable F420-dependent enzyme